MSENDTLCKVDGLEPGTVTPADRLEVEGVAVFDYRVYRVESALADKLLAMLETHGGRPSSRVKDLMDVIVYAKACEVDSRTLKEQGVARPQGCAARALSRARDVGVALR